MYINLDYENMNFHRALITIQGRLERDKRKQAKLEEKLDKEGEKLLEAVSKRGINVLARNKLKLELSDLENQEADLPQGRVQLDENERLLWPVLILYPETGQADVVQKFHEDTPYVFHLQKLFSLPATHYITIDVYFSIIHRLIEQLTEMLQESPGWDVACKYNVGNINVYFEGKEKEPSVHAVDVQLTLGEILQDKR